MNHISMQLRKNFLNGRVPHINTGQHQYLNNYVLAGSD
uniref:Uncharacterized protein n=1 Tax=Anguilla anguilla TaxID=7936 RepID=A0A0E9Q3D8_ANGAN